MRNFSSRPQQNNLVIASSASVSSPRAPVPVTLPSSAILQDGHPPHPQMSLSCSAPTSLIRSPASRPLPTPVRPAADSLLQQRQKQQQLQQSQLQAQLQQQSASSLPSPDPTIPPGSHGSPTGAAEMSRSAIVSPATIAFPSPPYQQVPPVHGPRQCTLALEAPSLLLAGNQQGNPNSSPVHQRDLLVGPRTPPLRAHHNPTLSTLPPHLPPPQSQSHGAIATFRSNNVNSKFFARAKYDLNVFVKTASGISAAVEAPRIHLLSFACDEQDFLYIFLHQIYCLGSADFRKLPGITSKHEQGLDVVRHLLVDNSRVSPQFLAFSANFPQPVSQMLLDRACKEVLGQVRLILAAFVDRWHQFENGARSRGYPPLVDEIAGSLGISSPILQFNIFLCLCRRIPGATLETELRALFSKDLMNIKRRYFQQVSTEERMAENNRLIQEYKAVIAAGLTVTRPPNPPVSSQAVSASVPGLVTVPASHNTPAAVQLQSRNHFPNDMASTPVTSPPVAPPPRIPQRLNSNQSIGQHRGTGAQVLPPQTAGRISQPLMATAAPHIPRPEVPQRRPTQQTPQQSRPQNTSFVQVPTRTTQMPAGYSRQPLNPQYVSPYQSQHPNQQQRNSSRLLPPPNQPAVMNTRPNPNRSAIHQAHLRDPVNRIISRDATGEREVELLPYLTSFVVGPKPLSREKSAFVWQFSLSESELQRRPKVEAQGKCERMLRTLIEGNQSYRLRCIKVPSSTASVSEHSWSVAETVWPLGLYMSVNGVEVHPRRKLHNGRDLPLEVTMRLREGDNLLSVNLIRNPTEKTDFTFAVAIEVITFRSFSHAKNLAQTLPAAESRRRICERLAAKPSADDDDELRIVSDDLKITLVDPFTARLFVIPVRGIHCEHPECFDRDTFLQTRLLKSGNCSAIEADWRCPICRQDARPQSLIVDGLLAEVGAELARTNRGEGVRALQVRADGSWMVQTEEDEQSSGRGILQPSRVPSKRKVPESEIGMHTPQRPKIDRSSSMPGEASSNPSSAVVILD
ncbi:hypothetical protein BJX61DRAFT_520881 [Aspergillus egyptiacus]|nr:hypothetical protein BJX61DRAFT_520881 [Aspergillus egyptiacus]